MKNSLKILILITLLVQPVLANDTAPAVKLGIDTLAESNYAILEGKRVGLLTHPAGVDSQGLSTIDHFIQSSNVNLTALYGPEHGIDGNSKAAELIPNRVHETTGVPIYSLHGDTRKPTKAMLQDIDVLVVDLQDVGVRSYTYVGCLKYAMEACFENGVEVVVLDRPNPLGGLKVDGPIVDKGLISYVGPYPMPYVYGLTIGELARAAKEERGWLKVSKKVRRNAKLTVVPMQGWQRSMLWPQTGLKWIPTSTTITDMASAMGYATTGLGSYLGNFKHGYGTAHPFRALSYSGKTAYDIKSALEQRNIPGVGYKVINYRDDQEKMQQALYVVVSDWKAFRPTELSFHMMQLACEWSAENPFEGAAAQEKNIYAKLVGSRSWVQTITDQGKRTPVAEFVKQWERDSQRFQQWSQKYWIYQ